MDGGTQSGSRRTPSYRHHRDPESGKPCAERSRPAERWRFSTACRSVVLVYAAFSSGSAVTSSSAVAGALMRRPSGHPVRPYYRHDHAPPPAMNDSESGSGSYGNELTNRALGGLLTAIGLCGFPPYRGMTTPACLQVQRCADEAAVGQRHPFRRSPAEPPARPLPECPRHSLCATTCEVCLSQSTPR